MPLTASKGQRRVFCPQVVQTSSMDCGPATAKAMLEGHGIRAAYGRLRESCQTEVDGTAIGSLEALIRQLGLEVEQVMVPVDHVLLQDHNLPSIAVVVAGAGHTHYVVAWRSHGGRVQIMDPATGRRFPTAKAFVRRLFTHQHRVDANAWRQWAGSEDFIEPLSRRLERLGARADVLIADAIRDPGWRTLAAVDAATRFVSSMVTKGDLRAGRGTEQLIATLVEQSTAGGHPAARAVSVPERFWSVWPDLEGEGPAGGQEAEGLLLRGAVLLRITGRSESLEGGEPGPVEDAMVHAIQQGDAPPWRLLLELVRRRGRRLLTAILAGAAMASVLVAVEALLLLGMIRSSDQLRGFGQIPTAIVLIVGFVGALTLMELAVASAARQLGRHLELRVRTAFLSKIPRLADRFFESRLRSDMAERAHSLVGLRALPTHLAELAASAGGLIGTTLALVFFFPDLAVLAVALALVSVVLPMASQPALREQVAALRTYAGGLSSFYLDALRGLTVIRAQRAESSLKTEHQSTLDSWLEMALSFNRRVVSINTVQALIGVSLAASMVLVHTGREGLGGGVLLLAYWALTLPEIGATFVELIQQLPDFRSIAARFSEPLDAPEEPFGQPSSGRSGPVEISIENVSVVASGHTILSDFEAHISAGERVAVVGPSGAGKSTFLGLLLGWHRPAIGKISIDGETLDVSSLRERTAWVDPAMTLWNRSLLANVRYGDVDGRESIETIVESAELQSVTASLPSAFATKLGEEGGKVAGGEAQRVRFARALTRRSAGLVILDEPFRGLESSRRRALLETAIDWWQDATILCATHDVSSVDLFDRVAVIDSGVLVEFDSVEALRSNPASHLSKLFEAEQQRERLWRSERWRQLWMEEGRLTQIPSDRASRV